MAESEKAAELSSPQFCDLNNDILLLVIHSYQARELNELSIQKGEELILVERGKKTLWKGKKKDTGQIGFFPCAYVKYLVTPPIDFTIKKKKQLKDIEKKMKEQKKLMKKETKKPRFRRQRSDGDRLAERFLQEAEEQKEKDQTLAHLSLPLATNDEDEEKLHSPTKNRAASISRIFSKGRRSSKPETTSKSSTSGVDLRLSEGLEAIPEEPGVDGKYKLFGAPLHELIGDSKRQIPLFVENILDYLDKNADIEGIFRVSGSLTDAIGLRKKLSEDQGTDLTGTDPYVVSGILKYFLRCMPEPLLTYELYNNWIDAQKIEDEDQKTAHIASVAAMLPVAHQELLKALLAFLLRITSNSDRNMMTIQNIATIFAPIICRAPSSNGIDTAMALLFSSASGIELIGTMLDNYEVIFKNVEEVEIEDSPEPDSISASKDEETNNLQTS